MNVLELFEVLNKVVQNGDGGLKIFVREFGKSSEQTMNDVELFDIVASYSGKEEEQYAEIIYRNNSGPDVKPSFRDTWKENSPLFEEFMHKETKVSDELFDKCSEIYTTLVAKGKLNCTFEEFKDIIVRGNKL